MLSPTGTLTRLPRGWIVRCTSDNAVTGSASSVAQIVKSFSDGGSWMILGKNIRYLVSLVRTGVMIVVFG